MYKCLNTGKRIVGWAWGSQGKGKFCWGGKGGAESYTRRKNRELPLDEAVRDKE